MFKSAYIHRYAQGKLSILTYTCKRQYFILKVRGRKADWKFSTFE